MIKLFRDNIPPPNILTDPKGRGIKETEDAKVYFQGKTKQKGKFKYSVYNEAEVKNALKKLSYGKCAYCESRGAPGWDYDVEHFRPKGTVTGPEIPKNQKGYYWLAASWDNLFLSCQHCNQSRVQEFIGGMIRTSGKKNQFPLEVEAKRAKEWTDKIEEEDPYRLLLDPVRDLPEEHFVYVIQKESSDTPGEADKLYVLMESRDTDAKKNKKAEKSMSVFGLNRKDLSEERHKQFLNIQSIMNEIEKLKKGIDDLGNIAAPKVEEMLFGLIQDNLVKLKNALDESETYLGMRRYFILPYLNEKKLRLPV